jgi:hypothetical protein
LASLLSDLRPAPASSNALLSAAANSKHDAVAVQLCSSHKSGFIVAPQCCQQVPSPAGQGLYAYACIAVQSDGQHSSPYIGGGVIGAQQGCSQCSSNQRQQH